jgi:hypothetical protein
LHQLLARPLQVLQLRQRLLLLWLLQQHWMLLPMQGL